MANEGKFRRLQCEQAVVGVVNDAIAEGDIQTGTKWYKHKLQGSAITYDEDSISFADSIIISTESTPITNELTFHSCLVNGFFSNQNIEVNNTPAIIIYSSHNGYYLSMIGSSDNFIAPIQSFTSCTDVVTPL